MNGDVSQVDWAIEPSAASLVKSVSSMVGAAAIASPALLGRGSATKPANASHFLG
jgi:hypothetical protein